MLQHDRAGKEKMSIRHKVKAPIASEHCRAICDEIGERLRIVLDREASTPSAHLLNLIARLDFIDASAASIAPLLEDSTLGFSIASANQ